MADPIAPLEPPPTRPLGHPEITLRNQCARPVDRFREVNRFGECRAGEGLSGPWPSDGGNRPSATTIENNDNFRPNGLTENGFGPKAGWPKRSERQPSLWRKLLIMFVCSGLSQKPQSRRWQGQSLLARSKGQAWADHECPALESLNSQKRRHEDTQVAMWISSA